MEVSECLGIEHEADIGAVRRRLAALAAAAGLDENRTSDAALVATELATNVRRHAGHGGALLGSIAAGSRRGVAIAAWDRGPGMDVQACLRDGMSTRGTAGVGLGAVSRLATRWDAYAPRGRGTVIAAYVLAEPPPDRGAATTVVRVDLAAREAVIAGVGNVAAWVAGDATRQLVTQHGTLGHTMLPRLREERYPFPAGATLVVASDGLKSRLELGEHPELLARDPGVIAAALWRDHHRGRDDATVVVLREAR